MFYNVNLMRSKKDLQKILRLKVIYILCLLLLTGCGNGSSDDSDTLISTNHKIRIVCTTFPQYDWMRAIIGDQTEQFDLTLLLDTGADPHSYQPTAKDIASISSADIFIYTGGESDRWMDDIIKEPVNTDMQVINLLDVLGDAVKEEETVEGMQEHRHREEEMIENLQEKVYRKDDVEYDEHVWLSLTNAKIFVRILSDIISQTDSEHAETYTTNATYYIQKLDQLDKQYEQAVLTAKFDTVLFGDRFPFRYLMDDYGLHYYAAFPGCSAETEAGFETITFLSGKMDDLGLDSILILENSDTKVAETIKQNTVSKDQNIFILNSIQSVTKTDLENGFTYLKAMQDNLDVLKQALH